VKDRLLSLDGTTARTFVQIKESTGRKDGGIVQRFADGGYPTGFVTGPGGPRDDLIDAKISNGEFVVNAYATSRNRDLLEQINSQRYAGGGFVVQRMGDGGYAQGYAQGVAAAAASTPSGPVTMRIKSGALDIRNGKAYVEGIAEMVVDNHRHRDAINARMMIHGG
jgi:hypothetical protein